MKEKNPLPVFDVRKLEVGAIEEYIECPKFPTIVRQADHTDDTEFHCVPLIPFVGPPEKGTDPFNRYFTVPKQEVYMVEDRVYGRFSVTKVIHEKDGPMLWLLSSMRSRMGFILPFNMLKEEDLKPQTANGLEPLQSALRGWVAGATPKFA